MKSSAVWLFAGVVVLSGCSAAAQEPESTEQTAPEVVVEEEPEAIVLPEGFPKEVPISELPENMQWAFEDDGNENALAIAEGVWAHLTPGATHEDAINSFNFEGFCSSKEAFERDYLDGQSTPGMCW